MKNVPSGRGDFRDIDIESLLDLPLSVAIERLESEGVKSAAWGCGVRSSECIELAARAVISVGEDPFIAKGDSLCCVSRTQG